jgi:hypothetical protein
MAQIHSHLVAAGLLVGLTTALTTPGFSQSSTKVGVLTCHTSVRFGLVLASRQRLRCQFSSDHGGSPEDYAGHIIHAGHDLSLSAQGIMVWGVLAPTNDWQHGALAGLYWHTSASAGPGLGVGPKTLVGRSHRSLALEPLSVAGVNLAVGIAGLRLRLAR